ncbi:MAG: hypothetical protein RL179_357 [Planctomycetota bacterium]|jgi:hypothetical protein
MMGNCPVIINPNHALLKVFFIALLTGCSSEPRTYPTGGKVVFKEDGSPFMGRVYFEAVNPPHTRSMATTKADGSFSLSTVREGSGSVEGEQVVRVDLDIPDSPDFKNRSKVVKIDYLDFITSPIRVNVKPGNDNHFVIEIERPAK